jgi:hypothetical protein
VLTVADAIANRTLTSREPFTISGDR